MSRSITTGARAAMAAGPDYFLAWYTIKSLGLVATAAALAWYMGREAGRNERASSPR